LLHCSATIDNRAAALHQYTIQLRQIKTAPTINEAITIRLKQLLYLQFESTTADSTLTTNTLIRDATIQQDEIGWVNFLRGRQSKIWEEAQGTYLELGGAINRIKAARWSTQIIDATLTLLTTIWKDRNDSVHSSNDDTPSARITYIHDQVREMYRQQDNFRARDRTIIFGVPLDDRLQQRPFQLVKWLETADLVLHENPIGRNQTTIHRFFEKRRTGE